MNSFFLDDEVVINRVPKAFCSWFVSVQGSGFLESLFGVLFLCCLRHPSLEIQTVYHFPEISFPENQNQNLETRRQQ